METGRPTEAEPVPLPGSPGTPVDHPELGGVRRLTARGVVINSAFQVGLGALNLLKALIAAAYLSAADYGIWSILLLALALVVLLKTVAVGNKYIQQDEPDQEVAFQKAFTLELLSTGVMFAVALAAAPLIGLAYGRSELIAPGLLFALVLPAMALQAPIWVFYRRMDFLRQRLFMAIDPVLSFIVTLALLVAGFDYWSLIVGQIAGSLTAGIAAMVASPYRLRLRYDHGTMREYLGFSWPLMLAAVGGLGIAQVSVFVGEVALGLAAVGAIGLASQFSVYTDKVDQVITQAMYPAICRYRDRSELLLEAFVKSNRIALMWGIPFGVGLSLFGADLVHFVIGNQWEGAIVLIQVFGLMAAANHIGFNWTAFYQAVGDTRPIAVQTGAAVVSFLALPVPLIFAAGLDGFAAGMAAMTVVVLAVRFRYLLRIFPDLNLIRYVVRAVAPMLPAVAAIAVVRLLDSSDRAAADAAAEFMLYIVLTALCIWWAERPLLREAISYVRPRVPADGLQGG